MKKITTPGPQWPGVFFCLLFCSLLLAHEVQAENCPARGKLKWSLLQQVVDGDTLILADGRKLRLIAVNAPELGRAGKLAQPLAREARAAVQAFFFEDRRVGVQLGADRYDRFGRHLAHVFRSNGDSLAAELLAAGLAWHIVVPPNDRYRRCLADREVQARGRQLGIWAAAGYQLKYADRLGPADTGFQRVRGTVRAVSRGRHGWWLQLDNLAIRLDRKDRHFFSSVDPMDWLNHQLTVRGWIIARSRSRAVTRHGHSPLMMHLRHPAMLK